MQTKKSDSREVKLFQNHKKNGGRETNVTKESVFEGRRLLRDALGAEEACACVRACLCKQKKSLNADADFGVMVKSEDEC